MGWRFRRSIRLMPGVRVNLGLTRASLSVGPRGFTYNIGSKGSRVTVGLPGTGISYTQSISHQNPVALIANAMPSPKRFSATPFVIIAFIGGLVYLATHSNASKPTPPAPAVNGEDVVGSVSSSLDGINTSSSTIPLPRPRPKPHYEAVGPPLQIVPQQ
jgi:Protein of unknown function (DUF4236)